MQADAITSPPTPLRERGENETDTPSCVPTYDANAVRNLGEPASVSPSPTERGQGGEVESLLIDLVSIPSPSYHEADAVRHLVGWMAEQSATRAYVDEAGNAVGEFGSGSRQIVLLGHIDTFGGALPVRVEKTADGRILHGRGSVDAKGSLCTFAAAASRAVLPEDVRVIVIGAVEEEAPTSKGAHYAAEQYEPEICLIGEPSNWDRITLGYKGRLLIDWRWHGGLGHSAGQVTSPGEHAFAYWSRIQTYANQFNVGREKVFARLDATLQAINTGGDGVHGWAEMTIGFRLPPGADPHQIAADLLPEDDATVRTFGMEYAYVADKDTALTRVLRGAIREQGGTPAFVHKTGTSDMNIVGRMWDCPIAAYGPGDSALDHTPEERISIDEYLRAVRVLTAALERL